MCAKSRLTGEYYKELLVELKRKFKLSDDLHVCTGLDNCDTNKSMYKLLEVNEDGLKSLDGMCILHMFNLASGRVSNGVLLGDFLGITLRILLKSRLIRHSLMTFGMTGLHALRPVPTRWLAFYEFIVYIMNNYAKLVRWVTNYLSKKHGDALKRKKVLDLGRTLLNPGTLAEMKLAETLLIPVRDSIVNQGFLFPWGTLERIEENKERLKAMDEESIEDMLREAVQFGECSPTPLPANSSRAAKLRTYVFKDALKTFSKEIPLAAKVWGWVIRIKLMLLLWCGRSGSYIE